MLIIYKITNKNLYKIKTATNDKFIILMMILSGCFFESISGEKCKMAEKRE